jgi:hypothetical protein
MFYNPQLSGVPAMTKSEMITQIRRINRSADEEFLASFTKDELLAYLHQLKELERDRRQCEALELAATD